MGINPFKSWNDYIASWLEPAAKAAGIQLVRAPSGTLYIAGTATIWEPHKDDLQSKALQDLLGMTVSVSSIHVCCECDDLGIKAGVNFRIFRKARARREAVLWAAAKVWERMQSDA